jgi:CspA family cold shock protein
MPIGTVQFYNPHKGYGFIRPDHGATDIFFHITAMEDQTTDPVLGARVGFDIGKNRSATALVDPTKTEMAVRLRYV